MRCTIESAHAPKTPPSALFSGTLPSGHEPLPAGGAAAYIPQQRLPVLQRATMGAAGSPASPGTPSARLGHCRRASVSETGSTIALGMARSTPRAAGQKVHAGEPADAYAPSGQGAGAEDPSGHADPAGHVVHPARDASPGRAPYVPGGQG